MIRDSRLKIARGTIRRQIDLFSTLGCPMTESSASILDFGCGDGTTVYAFRRLGYNAFGVDIELRSSEVLDLMIREGLCEADGKPFRAIAHDSYKIPFESESFDYVVSSVVFEHVMDYSQSLEEIYRVLKHGGQSFHIFPSRYCFIEPHTRVPFGAVIYNYPYFYLWYLIFGRSMLKGRTVKDVALSNLKFIRTQTNYLRKGEIVRHVKSHFGNIMFVDEHLWRNSTGKYKRLYDFLSKLGFVKAIPFALFIHSTFKRRVPPKNLWVHNSRIPECYL